MDIEWSVSHWRNQKENKKFPETSENENTTYQNIWDTAKAFLRGFMAMSAYIKKSERLQINNDAPPALSKTWVN
jgi:hypothetical protein